MCNSAVPRCNDDSCLSVIIIMPNYFGVFARMSLYCVSSHKENTFANIDLVSGGEVVEPARSRQ